MIRVMIVDDEYIMRQGLKYIIDWESEGYEIVGEATNGNEAIRLLDKLHPHIIICDIVMPVLDGVDFTEVVHRMYPQMQIIILSGYDNFEYVKRTLMSGVVDYILKPSLTPEEIRKILSKAVSRIPDHILQQQKGNISYERAIERYLLGHDKELKLPPAYFTKSCFRIYALNIKKENASGKDMSDVLYQKIERELEKYRHVQRVSIILQEELLCVILCYDDSEQEKLKQAVITMNEQLTLLSDSIFSIYSSCFKSLEMLKEVYQTEIVRNVDKSFYYEGQNILIMDNRSAESAIGKSYKFDFHRYNELLLTRKYAQAIDMLIQYHNMALAAQMDVYGLKNQMKNMLYHFLDLLYISDIEKEEYRLAFFADINMARYEGEYRRCIEQIMQKVHQLSHNTREQSDARIASILTYIEQNYQDDLKLEGLAEAFNFNYHYLSAYFNQQMNEGFSDYLNRLRIEKACKMLKETNHSVSDISGEVGYSEHSYFCRVFKKLVGKTPSEYRRNRDYE